VISNLPPGLQFEPITLVAPLGLRFWDAVSGALMTTGLTVAAAPKNQPGQTVMATVSSSGIYGFAHLPGMRELEHGAGDKGYWDSLTDAQRRSFVITVDDSEGRVHSFTLSVTAPQHGVYVHSCAGTTLIPTAPTGVIPLFSTPARPVPSGMAVIRTEVKENNQPAAWAVVEVRQGPIIVGHGLADDHGRAVVIFPYPVPPIRTTLLGQTWQLDLRTYHAPALNAVGLPNLCDILQQPQVDQRTVTVTYGRELVVK